MIMNESKDGGRGEVHPTAQSRAQPCPPHHYNCQWWPGSGSGVMRLLPSELDSSQSQAAARISWDTIFGGVTPLGGHGAHGRSRERQAGARQGIILHTLLFSLSNLYVPSILQTSLSSNSKTLHPFKVVVVGDNGVGKTRLVCARAYLQVSVLRL